MEADDEVKEAMEMKEKANRLFTTISHRPPLQDSIQKEDLDFEGRKSVSKGIKKALRDSNVRMIRMYEIGGVGKTPLAKEIDRDKLFDKVIIVTVTQTID